ncbi:MAG TPA: PGPGW domain-containing protein [Acidimicrobiia bacterium]|nr:PGPGW domain-containing protein [Acidimicrobiia bacterium]
MRERRSRAVDGRSLARFLVRSTRRLAVTVVGSVLVCVGIAGLLLPVLPGWLLIIAGFAALSREYDWAHSCLVFCRRHASRGGRKLRTVTTRGRRREVVVDTSGEVVIDLTAAQAAAREADDADADADSETAARSSRAL